AGRTGPAADAVPLFLGGAHLPEDDDVIAVDRGAVVPDRFLSALELHRERVVAELARLLRQDVRVGMSGAVRHALPEGRQDPLDRLDGLQPAALRRPREVCVRRATQRPDDYPAFGPLAALAGVRVLHPVVKATTGGPLPTRAT